MVRCLDAHNGRSLWQTDLAQTLAVEVPGFGYAATPLVEHNRVFLPAGGQGSAVVALGAQDGQLLWRSGDGDAGYSSCVLLEAQGYPHVVTFLEHSALGLDPATGRQLWQREWPGEYNPHATWPLYQDPYLFYARPFRGGSEVLQLIRRADGVRAEPVWTSEVISLDILSGVLVDGFVYGFDVRDAQTRTQGATEGSFKCAELATGVERWASDSPGHGSVLACGDRLVLLSESGELILVAANPERYEELARWPLFPGQRCWTAPVLYDGLLVARSREEFVCVSLAEPDRQFARTPGARGGGRGFFGGYVARAIRCHCVGRLHRLLLGLGPLPCVADRSMVIPGLFDAWFRPEVLRCPVPATV